LYLPNVAATVAVVVGRNLRESPVDFGFGFLAGKE
jgi:hypothetical protein